MKKICIFGAGAIGGYLACSLKNTKNKISIVARGQHKEIIEKKGLTLIKDETKRSFHFDISILFKSPIFLIKKVYNSKYYNKYKI